jgi:hypothetical protein
MEQKLVYRKTARGVEAVATRDGTLGPRERSMLIMVDGRRGSAELAAVTNAAELLASLAAKGLIEPVPKAAAAYEPTQPASLEDVAPKAPQALSVASAQRLAVRRLTELLGPHATELCLRVEKARNAQELTATFRHVENTLRQALGASAAARFIQEVGNVQGA